MNDTKKIMCRILRELKEDNDWTFDNMLGIQKQFGTITLSRDQLNRILNHEAKGVSIAVMDDLFYSLGYTTEVVLGTHFNYF